MEQKELFEHFHKDVYRTCYYMLKNQHDAEDVCQEVFIKIFTQDYEKIVNPKNWMLSIAMNTCRNHIRKHSKISVGHEFMNWITRIIDSQRVEEQVELKEQNEQISDFIHRLNPKIREVILLKYLHELKNEEIAKVLNIPLGTVKSRANKGVLLLRTIMKEKNPSHCTQVKEVLK
ncbi:RNA polymerase sigma factor [Paenibacillus frigoriresistens]|uniref:RNA polymerase sigma factor n=1 Tax=Paenibacillus alginolyticus TaxID=59839 RepID=UPI0015671494|nr:RNA polymerase sigma factor [Paenibacillus frigoriresistens]NRF94549.1 RNA polymerase sigma factor [Paenibacillus frigoriresistens]